MNLEVKIPALFRRRSTKFYEWPMDLETENRLAAMLMEEARQLRAQADKEGVHVYLGKPNIRGRPNSRFLTATVLGVEQANRTVEVNEMWRAREKEMGLDEKLKRRASVKDRRYGDEGNSDSCKRFSRSRYEERSNSSAYLSSSKRDHDDDIYFSGDEGGLRDDEVEEFLRSRAKRGRGSIGSRMDEPGPYPLAPSSSLDCDSEILMVDSDTREMEEWESRILGPEKTLFIKPREAQPGYADNSKKKLHSKDEKTKKRSKEERLKRKRSKEKKKHKHQHHKSRSRSDSD